MAEWSHTCLQPSGVVLECQIPAEPHPAGQVSVSLSHTHSQARSLTHLLTNSFTQCVSHASSCSRVFSGRSYFLLVLFCSTHSAPQFFQCRSPTPGAGSVPILDYQLLTASQCVTLYQVGALPSLFPFLSPPLLCSPDVIVCWCHQVTPVDGHSVCCRLEKAGGQLEVFRRARLSFSRWR